MLRTRLKTAVRFNDLFDENTAMNNQDLHTAQARYLRRRWFLRDCGIGLGAIAAGSLLSSDLNRVQADAVANPLAPRQPHFPGKAKRVIYIFQAGAPSHLEMFDNKPELTKRDGQLPPAELLKGYRAAFINPNSALLGSKFKYAKHGQCGMELSEVLPHTAKIADQLCLIRTMQTDAVNHAPAQIMMNTGSQQFGRPSLGSWTLYGLGSESADLPGFVVLTSAKGTSAGASNYGSPRCTAEFHSEVPVIRCFICRIRKGSTRKLSERHWIR